MNASKRYRTSALLAGLTFTLAGCSGSNLATPPREQSGLGGATQAAPSSLSGTTAFGGSGASASEPAGPNDYATGQILVKFNPGTSADNIAGVLACHGDAIIGTIAGLDVDVVQVPVGQERARIADYQRESSVKYAEPDYILKATFVPNDPAFGNPQWDMTLIKCDTAWDVTKGSRGVAVADLDTGIDLNHPEFLQKVVKYKNFTSTSLSVQDVNGHGTHTAGTIAAQTNNSLGISSVGFNTVLMVGKVLGDSGSGQLSWVANGITWAADNHAKVINMSLGSTSGSSTLQSAVDYAWAHGVVICAAAGNNNSSSAFYPAYYTNCIAVGATDINDRRASFSNWGSWVDVAAPGVNIYSTYPPASYLSASGTSMASPHVAGLAALVWASPYGTSNASVRAQITSKVDPITPDHPIGSGRIDAARAVGAIP